MSSANVPMFLFLQFRKDGYLLLDGFFSSEETNAMRDRMSEILTHMDLSDHPKSIFTSGESQLKVSFNSKQCELPFIWRLDCELFGRCVG